MANRKELPIIRAARAGHASAQLMLGKHYLFGVDGLPKSLPTALYWLDRAAQQDETEAWLLIGSHVPFETVRQAAQPEKLFAWYERAFDAGIAQAGLVLAKLVLTQISGDVTDATRSKAMRALQAAAHAGIAEAQWLLAQTMGSTKGAANTAALQSDLAIGNNEARLEWTTRAAKSGVAQARHTLAEQAWAAKDHPAFLQWALPLAHDMIGRYGSEPGSLSVQDIDIVLRCAHVLSAKQEIDPDEVNTLLEFAAASGNANAQYAYGLWLARMDMGGGRITSIPGSANYKKAIRWLALAAEQGLADARYALARIYQKPACSQRSLDDARLQLEKAAYAGHGAAQFELGMSAWRRRHENESNDVHAVYWLQKAKMQGIAEAERMLSKIAPNPVPAAWAQEALQRITRRVVDAEPLLAARIELAAVFGLSRTEALLIDPAYADRGHCLVVDVRKHRPHSKRRLILVQYAHERQVLNRVVDTFEREGDERREPNYRQRAYCLKRLAPG